jgi:hypothetical protein
LNSLEYPLSGVVVSPVVDVDSSVTSQPKLISSELDVVDGVAVELEEFEELEELEEELLDELLELHEDEPPPEPPQDVEVGLAVNVAVTVTLAAGIVNLLSLTSIVTSQLLTVQLVKL